MIDKDCYNKSMEILTPYPKKRNKIERFLDRHNHLMELMRTLLALITLGLQIIILSKVF